MRLLFDEQLSYRLPTLVAAVYPDCRHVTALNLAGADDDAVWTVAAAEGFVIVTKDEDFHRLSVLRGSPPKVVWLRVGNCSTADVAALLCHHYADVLEFVRHDEANFLSLGGLAAL